GTFHGSAQPAAYVQVQQGGGFTKRLEESPGVFRRPKAAAGIMACSVLHASGSSRRIAGSRLCPRASRFAHGSLHKSAEDMGIGDIRNLPRKPAAPLPLLADADLVLFPFHFLHVAPEQRVPIGGQPAAADANFAEVELAARIVGGLIARQEMGQRLA